MPNTKAPMTQRRPERRDRAAEARNERRDRHDDDRRDRDQQQAGEQAVGLAAREEAAPRRGEAELGLEKHDAEREAEQRSARGRAGCPSISTSATRTAVASTRGDQERPVEPRRSAAPSCSGGRSWRAMHQGVAMFRKSADLIRWPAAGMRQRAAHEPRPSAFFRSSQRVRDDATGRRASAVHSTIEPS